jgi:hypothetical protein
MLARSFLKYLTFSIFLQLVIKQVNMHTTDNVKVETGIKCVI